MRNRIYLCVLFLLTISSSLCAANDSEQQDDSTNLATKNNDNLLIFATLDGHLFGVEQQQGRIRWSIKDQPIVQVPVNLTDAIIPVFLPDPRDGSLYLLGDNREPLKKLPFTIPQLVASSPCRSSDGILYTGKKKDVWFRLDPVSGEKEQMIGWDISPSCPVESINSIFIGRTKYDIMMVDSQHSGRKWNVTFYDYRATPMDKEEINNYAFVHFASSSTGKLITMDRRTGNLLWERDLGSPIIAAYILEKEGLLVVPFNSLANHTLDYLTNELMYSKGPHHMKLYPTLYVGDHTFGLYALPSLVDQNDVTISSSDTGPLLLGGPNDPNIPSSYPEYIIPGYNYKISSETQNDLKFQSLPNVEVYIGHYNTPKYSDSKFSLMGLRHLNLITDESHTNSLSDNVKSIGIQTEDLLKAQKIDKTSPPKETTDNLTGLYKKLKMWLNQQENKGLKLMLIVAVGCVIAMFWYLQVQVREIQNLSQNGSKSGKAESSSTGKHSSVTAYAEELDDGLVKVGKITFMSTELLGKGCEGTFVYKGEFDSRKVAVKRLLPECFTFADREVALLRESDAHPNVIRYYCMEQDRLFRYIALELCQATLSDYVQGKCDKTLIRPLDILTQATSGLEHLHSLDIVHRDIKPHNVLLSMPNSQGVVKAMISDFGLCKKLQVGKVSFSRRSGVTGTDGWIAPEMLNGSERTTCAVDLFSLGCLFYYVLSNGCHPFGDAIRRQANILTDDWNLSELEGEEWQVNLQKPLLAMMISSNSHERPPCSAILRHPMFWEKAKILAYFQDVSDRVEKAEVDDQVLQSLEENSYTIVRADWRVHIHGEVASDLRKYRTYRGESVRDLLRALRNKKHHFRELTKEAQNLLGDIPDSFTDYWMFRFPLLLVHSWTAMQCVANESTFQHYYHHSYRFSYWKFREHINQYNMVQPSISVSALTASNALFSHEKQSSTKESTSPKKGLNIPYRENVGLYRNLSPVAFTEADDLSRTKRRGIHGQTAKLRSRYNKRASKKDEPLLWAIKDDNK